MAGLMLLRPTSLPLILAIKRSRLYFCLHKCRHQNPLDPNAPDMTQFKTVEEWLCSIKMARYHESFQRGGFTTMEAVSRLTLKDLAALGVVLVGHQKKIMNSVQTLRAQINATMSDGCVV